jgi:hypothetical protein
MAGQPDRDPDVASAAEWLWTLALPSQLAGRTSSSQAAARRPDDQARVEAAAVVVDGDDRSVADFSEVDPDRAWRAVANRVADRLGGHSVDRLLDPRLHPWQLAGETRTYLVFCRDPIVLGGRPSVSTCDATQTGVGTWSS